MASSTQSLSRRYVIPPSIPPLLANIHVPGVGDSLAKTLEQDKTLITPLTLAGEPGMTLLPALYKNASNIPVATSILRVLNTMCTSPSELNRDTIASQGGSRALISALETFKGEHAPLEATCSAIRNLAIHSVHRSEELVRCGVLLSLVRTAGDAHGRDTAPGREEKDRSLAASTRGALGEIVVVGFKKKIQIFGSHWLPRHFTLRQDVYTGRFSMAYSAPDSASFAGTIPLVGLKGVRPSPPEVVGKCSLAAEYGRFAIDLEVEGRTFHLMFKTGFERDNVCSAIMEGAGFDPKETLTHLPSFVHYEARGLVVAASAPSASADLAPPPSDDGSTSSGGGADPLTSVGEASMLAAQAELEEQIAELRYNAAGEEANKLESEIAADEAAAAAAATATAAAAASHKHHHALPSQADLEAAAAALAQRRAKKVAALEKVRADAEAAALAMVAAEKAERRAARALRKAEEAAAKEAHAAAEAMAAATATAAGDVAAAAATGDIGGGGAAAMPGDDSLAATTTTTGSTATTSRDAARSAVQAAHKHRVMSRGPPPKPTVKVTAKSRAQKLMEEEQDKAKSLRMLRLGALWFGGLSREGGMTEVGAAVLVQSVWRAKLARRRKEKVAGSNVQQKLAMFNKVLVEGAGEAAKHTPFFDGPGGKELDVGWQRIDGDSQTEGVPYYINLTSGESQWSPKYKDKGV